MILTVLLALAAAGGPQNAEPATATPPAKARLICRRETPIGSLIASRKVCLTKEQWAQREDDGNDAARKMAYDNMGRPSCTDANTC